MEESGQRRTMSEAQSYEYDELSPGRFRVVEFLPSDDHTVECRILDGSIEGDVTPYDALSYTWGDHEKTESINIAGQILPITWNLFNALRNLRGRHKRLWIDAICINQKNFQERELQVQEMAKIYQRAANVVIWLGAATTETDSLMSTLESLEKEYTLAGHDWTMNDPSWLTLWNSLQATPGEAYRDYALTMQQRYGLKDLMARSWFTRIWIIQEVAFAQAAMVYCGIRCVSGKIFALAPSLIDVKIGEHRQAILDIMPGCPRDLSWWGQCRDLLTLLRKFRHSSASEARDRIFALIGLCSEVAVSRYILPNYRTTDVEVVKQVIYILFGFDEEVESSSDLEIELVRSCPTISALVENLDMLESQALAVYGLNQSDLEDNRYDAVQTRFRGRYGTTQILLRSAKTQDMLLAPGMLSACAANLEDGYATMDLLLQERKLSIQLTEDVILAAAKNQESGGAILDKLFRERGDEVELTADVLIYIVMMNLISTVQIILSQRSQDEQLREDVLWLALRFERLQMVCTILHQHTHHITATSHIVTAACRSPRHYLRNPRFEIPHSMDWAVENVKESWSKEDREGVLALLSKCRRVEMTEAAVCLIIRNCSTHTVQLLFDQCSDDFDLTTIVLGIEWYVLRADTLEMLFERYGEKFKITSALLRFVLENCFRNKHNSIISMILERHGKDFDVAMQILNIAIQQGLKQVGFKVLDHYNNHIKMTWKIIRCAVDNKELRDFWLQTIFRRCSDLDITPCLVRDIVAVCQTETVTLLLGRVGDEIPVTESILRAAASNNAHRRAILPLLLENCPEDLRVSETWLIWSDTWSKGKTNVARKYKNALIDVNYWWDTPTNADIYLRERMKERKEKEKAKLRIE